MPRQMRKLIMKIIYKKTYKIVYTYIYYHTDFKNRVADIVDKAYYKCYTNMYKINLYKNLIGWLIIFANENKQEIIEDEFKVRLIQVIDKPKSYVENFTFVELEHKLKKILTEEEYNIFYAIFILKEEKEKVIVEYNLSMDYLQIRLNNIQNKMKMRF